MRALTQEAVRNIRARWAAHLAGGPPESVRALAAEHGVGTETIRRVLRRETWSSTPEQTPLPPFNVEESLSKLQALLEEPPA